MFKIDELDALDGIYAWDNQCGSGVRNDEFKEYLRDNREYTMKLLDKLCKFYNTPPNSMSFECMESLVKWAHDELGMKE